MNGYDNICVENVCDLGLMLRIFIELIYGGVLDRIMENNGGGLDFCFMGILFFCNFVCVV